MIKHRQYVGFKNKKGSSAVFLTVILASLISIALTLIYGAKTFALQSTSDAVVNLAGNSLLSEYNSDVQREYGLFIIKGREDLMTNKLKDYVEYSLESMEGVKINHVKASADKYSITDSGLIKEQLVEHATIMELSEAAIERKENTLENRSLQHGPTISSLPSSLIPSKGLIVMAEELADKAAEVDIVFKEGTDNYMLNRYIIRSFNSSYNMADEKHFFRNEVEYILAGELSDIKNRSGVEDALKTMRFPINLAYLYSDPEKQAALASAAQLMTPGAAAVATQAVLASTWAYVETDNDIKLLMAGNRVPMLKDDSTWAIELDKAIEGISGGTVLPSVEKGYDYNDYLQILLFFQDDDIKLGRIMDLIQINMRKQYDEDFMIGEYAVGITIKVKINGKTYAYDKKY